MKMELGAKVTQEMVDYILSLTPIEQQKLREELAKEGDVQLKAMYESGSEELATACEQLRAGLDNMFYNPQRWMDIQAFPRIVDPADLPVQKYHAS